MRRLISLLIISIFLSAGSSIAHPGRTDSSGCHTCRTNCGKWGLSYGEYHCHGAKRKSKKKVEKKIEKKLSCEHVSLSGYSKVKFNQEVIVRKGPGKKYKRILRLKAGQIAIKVEVSGDWVKIKYKKRTGWVYRCLVEGSE